MSEQVIAEVGDLRARVVLDECPDPPYDHGASPVLCLEWRDIRGWRSEQVKEVGSYEADPAIIDALSHWGGSDKWERYLRIFHGVTRVEWYQSRDGRQYVTFDPAEWRAEQEITNDWLAQRRAEGDGLDPVNMAEWTAYLEGEVYGWVVEEREVWQARRGDREDRETWETVESCWGYYGNPDYVEEEVREALRMAQEERSKR